jgi:hypothetical protein
MTPQESQPAGEQPSPAVANTPRMVFMANDAMFAEGLAFLESFRTHNPTLPLSMIPFADDIAKIERLSPIYRFDILQLDTRRWDELARGFYPTSQQKYRNRLRKLAIFDVKAPTTIYLDIDVVVLKDLSFLAAKIIDGTTDLICTGINNDPYVYNPNYKAHPQLLRSKRFSDGFFAFNPGKIDADGAFRAIVENMDMYLEVRALDVYSQPATNFVIDMLGLRVREVYSLFPRVSPQVWYAGRISEQDGQVTAEDGKDVLFVHWAGPVNFKRDFRLKTLFDRYHSAGLSRIGSHGLGG